jgi:hypothetical protein
MFWAINAIGAQVNDWGQGMRISHKFTSRYFRVSRFPLHPPEFKTTMAGRLSFNGPDLFPARVALPFYERKY